MSLFELVAGGVLTDAVQALLKAVDADGDSKLPSAKSDTFVEALSAKIDSTDVPQTGTRASFTLLELVQRA